MCRIANALESIAQSLIKLSGEKSMSPTPNALDTEIAALQSAVENETTVDQSAVTLINGIPGMIQTAVNAALAAGATSAELAALTALQTTIANNASSLAAAVSANTPAAPSSTKPAGS
jgi:hypothetical protein